LILAYFSSSQQSGVYDCSEDFFKQKQDTTFGVRTILETLVFQISSSQPTSPSFLPQNGTNHIRTPDHPYYHPISPPPFPREVSLIEASVFISDTQLSQRLGGLSDFVFAQLLDEHSVILVPREYIHDDPEQLWRKEASAVCCFRTCIACELLSGDLPNLARSGQKSMPAKCQSVNLNIQIHLSRLMDQLPNPLPPVLHSNYSSPNIEARCSRLARPKSTPLTYR